MSDNKSGRKINYSGIYDAAHPTSLLLSGGLFISQRGDNGINDIHRSGCGGGKGKRVMLGGFSCGDFCVLFLQKKSILIWIMHINLFCYILTIFLISCCLLLFIQFKFKKILRSFAILYGNFDFSYLIFVNYVDFALFLNFLLYWHFKGSLRVGIAKIIYNLLII